MLEILVPPDAELPAGVQVDLVVLPSLLMTAWD
jgi:hypothetical protein